MIDKKYNEYCALWQANDEPLDSNKALFDIKYYLFEIYT